jgi:hypothetical protein
MTGFVFAMAPCLGCNRIFSFNPALVPSLMFDGERKPLCEKCFAYINRRRVAVRLPALVTPPGAYQPMSEDEL